MEFVMEFTGNIGSKIKGFVKYAKLIRVNHWMKNILIFFPIIFSGNLLVKEKLLRVIYGFILFCLASSIIYIINDLRDLKQDRVNHNKSNRPLASGRISPKQAKIITLMLFFCFASLTFFWGRGWIYLTTYLVINILYSFGLKNIPIFDVVILVAGYIIRLLYGGYLAETGVSDWMLLTVMMASFFLGFGKRKGEFMEYKENGRKSLKGYNKTFLDNSINMFLTLTIVFYSLTCLDKKSGVAQLGVNMLWTVPVVIVICLRYSVQMESDHNCSGDPVEIVTHDKLLMLLLIFYAFAVIVLLYL